MSHKIKIHLLRCGEVGVDPAVPFRDVSKNPIAYTGLGRRKSLRIWLPVYAYLIEHPKGLVLFDTGWHRDVRRNQKKHMSFKLNVASKARLNEGEAVDEQLLSRGIKPEDLDYVILSHMDVDHVSGIEMVKNAKNILTSKEELNAANKGALRYSKRLWENVEIKGFEMKESEYGPYNRAFDIFGDGKVLIVDASGHTDGNSVALIRDNEKFVLLTGDCGYAKDSWEKLRIPGPVEDSEKMIESLKWVREMAHKDECIEVLATHDPDVKPHIIEF